MSTAAERRFRGARNGLVDLLGLGEPLPLRDLPVAAAPPIVPVGGAAAVTVEDTEPGVAYRLRAQAGAVLPGGIRVEGTGTGETLTLVMPRVDEALTFTVEATTRRGHSALLAQSASVTVGLDSGIPAAVAGFETEPALIDFDTAVTIALPRSQEAVSYRLVARPPGDTARHDDPAALAADIPLSAGADVRGTGGALLLPSLPLRDDTIVRVRMVKALGGRTQVSLLDQRLPVYVRADRARPVAVAPPVSDHAGAPTLTVAGAQAGVRYRLHLAPVTDAAFDRTDPPDAAALTVATDGGPVRVLPPALPRVWEPLRGYAPAGEPGVGANADLALPMPPLVRDTMAAVQATKRHGEGEAAFDSAVPLASAALALVRPAPAPPLRLEAHIAEGALTGITATGGEAGVFYALASGRTALGEVYFHQLDLSNAARNKGVDQLVVEVDFAIASDAASAAPPPVPRLELEPRKLPLKLALVARRAMSGLLQPLAAKPTIAAAPEITVDPAAVAEGGTAKVTLASAAVGAGHQLLIDGAAGDRRVEGADGPLTLDTGPLKAGATVELLIADPPEKGVAIDRRIAVPLKIG